MCTRKSEQSIKCLGTVWNTSMMSNPKYKCHVIEPTRVEKWDLSRKAVLWDTCNMNEWLPCYEIGIQSFCHMKLSNLNYRLHFLQMDWQGHKHFQKLFTLHFEKEFNSILHTYCRSCLRLHSIKDIYYAGHFRTIINFYWAFSNTIYILFKNYKDWWKCLLPQTRYI